MADEDRKRLQLQFEHFQKALERLKEALAEPESSFVRDSIIQRFEFTFEMAWKTLHRFLTMRGERVAAKAWDVIPEAFKSLLIADADLWDRMREYRNDMSHEYNEVRAIEIAAFIRAQAVGGFELLQADMQKRL